MGDIRKNRGAKADFKVDCFVCGVPEPLPTAEDHHRKPRAFGGDDSESNRVWLCPSCHARLHRVQEFLLKGQAASGYQLCNDIFPTNGKARGNLWTLANEAAEAEREAKEVFGQHKTHRKVTLSVDVDVWETIKTVAKGRKVSASRFAADILRKAVQDHL